MSCAGAGSGFDALQEQQLLLLCKVSTPAPGLGEPPLQWVPGAFSCGKRPGREADHSSSSSAEAKNEWSYASAPSLAFMACTGAWRLWDDKRISASGGERVSPVVWGGGGGLRDK
jgi:hypothetical protein